VKKVEEDTKKEQETKVYSFDFMMSLKLGNRERPVNMALLDFPHKRRKADFRK